MTQLPFTPAPGQTDFTHLRYAPVINCVVQHAGRILIVERSPDLNFYPGYWNGISGFLDDHRTVEEKAFAEIQEELGFAATDIIALQIGQTFEQAELNYAKTWIVHPVLVDVAHDRVTLDWEARKFAWVKPQELESYTLLPGFDRVVRTFFRLATLAK